MGLSGAQANFVLPERLPDLPAAPREIRDAEAQAMANRLDVLMAQKELAGLAKSLGLTRATRFVNLALWPDRCAHFMVSSRLTNHFAVSML